MIEDGLVIVSHCDFQVAILFSRILCYITIFFRKCPFVSQHIWLVRTIGLCAKDMVCHTKSYEKIIPWGWSWFVAWLTLRYNILRVKWVELRGRFLSPLNGGIRLSGRRGRAMDNNTYDRQAKILCTMANKIVNQLWQSYQLNSCQPEMTPCISLVNNTTETDKSSIIICVHVLLRMFELTWLRMKLKALNRWVIYRPRF